MTDNVRVRDTLIQLLRTCGRHSLVEHLAVRGVLPMKPGEVAPLHAVAVDACHDIVQPAGEAPRMSSRAPMPCATQALHTWLKLGELSIQCSSY